MTAGKNVVEGFRGLLILLAVMFMMVSAAFGQEPDSPLKFVGNDKIPPIIFMQNGKPAGLAVDLAYAVARKAHLKIRVEPMDWSEAQSLVTAGKADALLQMNPTPEREKLYDFSDTLLESNFHIFRKTMRLDVQGLPSLYGKKVGVERNGFPVQLLKKYNQIQAVIVPNWNVGFQMLKKEQLDAILVDRWVGEYELYLNKIDGVTIVETPIFTDYSRIAVKKGNGQLLARINLGLKEIARDGTRQDILKKWEPKEVVYITRESVGRLVLWAAFSCIAVLIIIVWRAVAHTYTIKKLNDELTKKNAMLLEAQENLEERVSQRTAELEQLYTTLHTEVTERKQVEEALRESRDRFQVLTRNMESGVALVDELGRFSIVNPAFLRIFDLPDESNIANVNDRDWGAWQVYDEYERLLDVDEHPVRKAAMTGKPVQNKLVGVRSPARNTLIWILVCVEPIFKPDGQIDAMVCTYHDITELRQAEIELRHSSQQRQLALDAARMGWWHYDPITRIATWDDRYREIFGVTGNERANDEILAQIIYPDDLPQLLAKVEAALNPTDRKAYAAEYRITRPDGVMRWIEAYGLASFEGDVDNQIATSFVGTVADITERKRTEEALRESEERYRTLYLSMNEGFYLSDIIYNDSGEPCDYRFVEVNPAYQEMMALSREQLVGKRALELFPDLSSGWIGVFKDVATTGIPAEYSFYSSLFNRHFEVYAFKSSKDQFAVLVKDVTERKQLQQQMEEVYQREHHIAEMLQQALIPSQIPTTVSGCYFAAKYVPALDEAQVGGDFYDVFNLGDGKVAVLIGDVAGKGVRAAMQVSAVRYAFRSYAYIDPRPSRVVSLVNNTLCKEQSREGSLFTAFFAVVDTQAQTISYTNAGHEPPVIRRANGNVEEMSVGAIVLGILPGCNYPEESLELEPGDVVVLVTDGITEARSQERGMFGKAQMLRFLTEDDSHPSVLVDRLLAKAREYGDGQLQDDVAIVVLGLETSYMKVGSHG